MTGFDPNEPAARRQLVEMGVAVSDGTEYLHAAYKPDADPVDLAYLAVGDVAGVDLALVMARESNAPARVVDVLTEAGKLVFSSPPFHHGVEDRLVASILKTGTCRRRGVHGLLALLVSARGRGQAEAHLQGSGSLRRRHDPAHS